MFSKDNLGTNLCLSPWGFRFMRFLSFMYFRTPLCLRPESQTPQCPNSGCCPFHLLVVKVLESGSVSGQAVAASYRWRSKATWEVAHSAGQVRCLTYSVLVWWGWHWGFYGTMVANPWRRPKFCPDSDILDQSKELCGVGIRHQNSGKGSSPRWVK